MSCPNCNRSRRNTDLMLWHSQRKTFPTLSVLGRCTKLCRMAAKALSLNDESAEAALAKGLPFAPAIYRAGFQRLPFWSAATPRTSLVATSPACPLIFRPDTAPPKKPIVPDYARSFFGYLAAYGLPCPPPSRHQIVSRQTARIRLT